MGKHFISLKPRFQNAKRRAPPRTADALDLHKGKHDGHIMRTKYSSTHAQTVSRVEKLNPSTRKRRSRNNKTLMDRFGGESFEIDERHR